MEKGGDFNVPEGFRKFSGNSRENAQLTVPLRSEIAVETNGVSKGEKGDRERGGERESQMETTSELVRN